MNPAVSAARRGSTRAARSQHRQRMLLEIGPEAEN
jgi:hypothetical protein